MGLSGVFSSTTVKRHQFFGILPLYGPALTTVHDHWEDHSLDYTDLRWRSNVSAFQHCLGLSSFLAKKQLCSDFMVAITVHHDSGAQEEEICHYFHIFSYLHAVMGLDAMILGF